MKEIKYDKGKFLVINRERFEDLFKAMVEKKVDKTIFFDLAAALQSFYDLYKELVGDHKLDHTWYVVNSDEPYAEDVWSLIKGQKLPTATEAATYKDGLMELLAVIHKDGGYHTAQVGVQQAVADAVTVVRKDRLNPHNPYRQDLLNLLAIIHKDGGHHVAKHGVKQAVVNATRVIYQDRAAAM